MDFDYKKYSLEKLETWVEDAINSSEASPQEIYNCIRKVVEDNYYHYKNSTSRCYELLCLLNGNGKGHIQAYDDYVENKENLVCDNDKPSPECQKSWNDFWEEYYYPDEHKSSTVSSTMPPWGHSDMEALRYTEEELNAMCDKAASDEEKEKCIEYNIRETEFLNDNLYISTQNMNGQAGGSDYTYPVVGISTPVNLAGHSDHYYDYTRNDLNRENPFKSKRDKVKKWVLPVEETKIEETDEIEYFVSFPDDLLEAANLREGDQIEWVDQGDGSYILRKVTNA